MARLRDAAVGGAYRLVRADIHPPISACSALVEVIRLRRCLIDLGINCVLDVGANTGQFTTRLRRLGYAGWVYSFEPNPQAFKELQGVHGTDPLWRGFPIALGSTHETKEFYVQADSSLSSFLVPVERASEVLRIEVEVQPLDAIFDDLVAEIPGPRILLKMDTQGWDLEVVKGTRHALSRIDALLSELSVQALYEGMTPYLEALEFYARQGFVLYDITPINHAVDGTVVECDCLMVRRGARTT